ncbi:MAG: hypothetical protein GVY36_19780 [Verrucomicrobia bacterium]|jgi:hypothetical protein|nr:hypothetical protein [Verrucomicrobiota bacterium]
MDTHESIQQSIREYIHIHGKEPEELSVTRNEYCDLKFSDSIDYRPDDSGKITVPTYMGAKLIIS